MSYRWVERGGRRLLARIASPGRVELSEDWSEYDKFRSQHGRSKTLDRMVLDHLAREHPGQSFNPDGVARAAGVARQHLDSMRTRGLLRPTANHRMWRLADAPVLREDWATWDAENDRHGGELYRRVRAMQPGERMNAMHGGYIRRLPRPDLAGHEWETGAGGFEQNRHASPEEAIGQIVGREGARFAVRGGLREGWQKFDALRRHTFEGVVRMNRTQAVNVLEGVGRGQVDPTDLRHDEIEHLRNNGASFLIDAERQGAGAQAKAKRVREGLAALPRVHSLHPSMRERLQMLTEAKARTRFDEMDEDALRAQIGRYKALGDQAPATAMIRASQALARKLALREAVPFDPFKHPRARGGKFARVMRVNRPLPQSREGLHGEWADLDRELLPYAGHPEHPEARDIIDRQKQITAALHHSAPSWMMSPGTTDTGVHDVVVVGSGPAGLSAAIYGGTEGLDTVLLEKEKRAGGQAGLSSRIENVMGFPAGVTGRQFAHTSLEQAERVGAETRFGNGVSKLDYDPDSKVKTLTMEDGSKVKARAVVIAGGVQFRKLGLPDEKPGEVVYGDSDALKQAGEGGHVAIVGGANSAGQAAIDAATKAKHVTILLRHGALGDKMSDYLVKQIEGDRRISVESDATIDQAKRDKKGKLSSVVLKDGREVKAAAVGAFIGSAPRADWSGAERDERGFIKTGANLETSVPGVFAAGDVRAGSMHRVIAAGGDGAQAISHVHEFLSTLPTLQMREAREDKQKPKPKPKPDEADKFMDDLDRLDQQTPFTGGEQGPEETDAATTVQEALRLALAESWAEWDAARKSGQFSKAVKSGPMPGGVHDSPGRGPTGKLRNFAVMSPSKLTETLKALKLHGEDPEAHKAAMAVAADKLGVKFGDAQIHVPAKHVPGASAGGQLLIQ